MPYSIITRIKQARTKKGLTLYRLSKKTGIAISNLSRFEKGTSSPTLKTLKKICKYLDIEIGVIRKSKPRLTNEMTKKDKHYLESIIVEEDTDSNINRKKDIAEFQERHMPASINIATEDEKEIFRQFDIPEEDLEEGITNLKKLIYIIANYD